MKTALENLKRQIQSLNFKDHHTNEDKKELNALEKKLEKYYGIEISNEDYHAQDGLSRSGIDKIIESPWHYYKYYLAPDRPKFEETKPMKKGTAIHMALLEPELFAKKYICYSGECDRRLKEYKEFSKQYDGLDVRILNENEYKDIMESVEAILKDKTASLLIDGGIHERSFFYYDKNIDCKLRIRPDVLSKIAMCDVKKTVNANKYNFEKDANKYKYYLEAAFYLWIYELITGIKLDSFVFIAVEDKYPHQVNSYMYEQEDLSFAFDLIQDALEVYKKCKLSNEWPQREDSQIIQTIKIPDYIKLRRL